VQGLLWRRATAPNRVERGCLIRDFRPAVGGQFTDFCAPIGEGRRLDADKLLLQCSTHSFLLSLRREGDLAYLPLRPLHRAVSFRRTGGICHLSSLHSHPDLSMIYSVIRMSISIRNVIIRMNSVQCRMARTALQITTIELATLSKVAPSTVARLEAGERLQPRTVEAIRSALEKAGVEFLAEDDGGPGVRLKKSRSKRAKS
jgi:hypothetical protein